MWMVWQFCSYNTVHKFEIVMILEWKSNDSSYTTCLCGREIFFWCPRVWTWGFALARQALSHLNHACSPFCSGYFEDRVLLFCPGWPGLPSSYFSLSAVAGITDVCHHAHLFLLNGGVLWTFFAWTNLKLCDLPNFCLSSRQYYRSEPLCLVGKNYSYSKFYHIVLTFSGNNN
jgi:hypothetical protein